MRDKHIIAEIDKAVANQNKSKAYYGRDRQSDSQLEPGCGNGRSRVVGYWGDMFIAGYISYLRLLVYDYFKFTGWLLEYLTNNVCLFLENT